MAVNAILGKAKPYRDAYLDWLQMLSGVILVVFIWCHMLLVSSIIISPRLMSWIADFMEATYLAQIGGPLIFLVFLFHFVLAARKIPFTADGQKVAYEHAKMLKHKDTWLWLAQVVTAMCILILASIHMWVVLNDLPISPIKSAIRVQSGSWALFYVALLFLTEIHVSVGVYRIGVKWGFIKRAKRPLASRVELYIFLVFIAIGLATIIVFFRFSLNDIDFLKFSLNDIEYPNLLLEQVLCFNLDSYNISLSSVESLLASKATFSDLTLSTLGRV